MKQKPDQRLLDLYDRYAHGFISRRQFFHGAAAFAVGGMSVTALVESLLPDYAHAKQTEEDDPRLDIFNIEYPSPKGAGTMGAYLVCPTASKGPWPGVVVIHENRGRNPYIEDVARRLALENFLVLAPDALFPLGGYPGDDDRGRAMQRERDRTEMQQDFIAAVEFLQTHDASTGQVGCVGFCYGGGISNLLAARVPDLACAVPYYGRPAPADEIERINAPLQLHFGELDKRVNALWPEYETALKKHEKTYEAFFYSQANHGFHNDTTPRYDPDAAKLAWQRTVDFFNRHLR